MVQAPLYHWKNRSLPSISRAFPAAIEIPHTDCGRAGQSEGSGEGSGVLNLWRMEDCQISTQDQLQQQKFLTEEQLEQRRERLRTYMSQRWMQMSSEERERLRERRRNTDRLRRLRMTEEQLERRREQRRNYMRRRRNLQLGLPANADFVRLPRIRREQLAIEDINVMRVQGRTRLNHIRKQARMGTGQSMEIVEDDTQGANARISDQLLLDEMKRIGDTFEDLEIFLSQRRIRLTIIRRIARLIGSQQNEKMHAIKMEIANDVEEDVYHDEGLEQDNGILQNQRRLRLTEIRRQARLIND